jgi:hypothetical protein
MILRPVLANSLVWSAPIDPSATFEAGQIAGMIEINGELFITVSDGKNIPPIGIIDDTKTTAFSGTVVDEIQVVPSASIEVNGILVSSVDVMAALNETNIIDTSFTCNLDVVLNPKKGIIVVPAGTPLNFDNGSMMGFEIKASYRFKIVDYPGNDSTDGSGQISIHFNRGIFITNIFDTLATYMPGSSLFVDFEGKLTSQETESPIVAVALQPASALTNELMFMWL